MLPNKENLNKTDEKPHFPLSFAQQRLWFLEQLNPQKSIYNISKSVLLIGSLNIEVLTAGIKSIIARHENLRTSIITHMGKATQIINSRVDFDIDYQDLSNTPKKERTLLIKKRLRLEAGSPFNLSKTPLFRCTLLRLSPNEHIISLTFHHIITDAWSMDIFFSELSEFYNASIENRLPKLPELPVQYIDFAVWQREFFTSQVIKKQLDYWRDSLTGIPNISSLPSDYVRPKEASYRGISYRYVIPPNILHIILQLAHEYNVTLFTILITVYQILLHRFSNQDSIVTGTPVLNRHYPKVENLIGFFVNTLAMRLDCEGNPKFIDLLLKNQTNVLTANENQDVPFEQIVDYLKIERDLSRHPIFQTWFVLQNKADSLLTFRNLGIEEVEVDEYTSKFDLALWVKETTHSLELNFEYSTDLFQEETIKQFAISFEIMLKAIGKNPEARIEEIPLVSDEFKASIINWNKEVKLPHTHTLIHELIEAQAAKVPHNTALKFELQTLTYQQLMRDVNQLARFLQPYIIPGQSRVILALPRGFDAIIALLATIKVGSTYIPVDSNWPKARLEYILEDSKAEVVLTYKQSSSLYLSQPRLVLALDELRSQWQSLDDSPVSVPLDPEQLAYIIYTSGSTGQPKGVLVPHRGLVNLALAQSQIFEINEKSRVLQFAPLSFDASVSEWSTTLSQGGCLCFLAEKAGKLVGDLTEIINENSISVVTLPPSVAKILSTKTPKSLKTLVLAGEAGSQALIDQWVGQLKLINAYGPTETTVCATTHVYQSGDLATLIGRPLPNVQVYLVNKAYQLVPPGVRGEIVVGGLGIAKGYLNREQLTSERFIPDFIGKGDQYLYHTGDLGKYKPNGVIEYIGRMDHQIKLRGYRIELGEIEETLRSHPIVEEAIVLLKEIKPGQKTLVAYTKLKEQKNIDVSLLYKDELANYLRDRLPNYMIPEKWILIKEWALTTSGKIDRQALPDLEPSAKQVFKKPINLDLKQSSPVPLNDEEQAKTSEKNGDLIDSNESSSQKQSLGYWKEQLGEVPNLFEFLLDKSRPKELLSQKDVFYCYLSKESKDRLNLLAYDHQVPLFAVLLAIFQVLLYRYSSQKDVIVGSPVSNLQCLEKAETTETNASIVALKTTFNDNDTFVDTLNKVKETILKAYKHQDVTLEEILNHLEITTELNHNSIFQVGFFSQKNLEKESLALKETKIESLKPPHVFEKSDLNLLALEDEEGVGLKFEYAMSIFEKTTIEKLAQHFEKLVQIIGQDPLQPIQDLALLTPQEEQKFLIEINDTKKEYSQSKSLHMLFEEQVQKNPNNIAVAIEDKKLTYQQLNERANQLAYYLRSLGVSSDTLVAIAIEKSLELVVGLLGILKAGGAYVPLDPSYPPERIQFMLEDSCAPFILTDMKSIDKVPITFAQVICLDDEWSKIEKFPSTNLESLTLPHNLAYVIYTSGSTGKPKGVMIENQSFLNHMLWMKEEYKFSNKDIVLQRTACSFDASVWELFLPLIAGAKIVLFSTNASKDFAKLAQVLNEYKITTLQLVPSALMPLLQSSEKAGFPHLKQLFVGGEALPSETSCSFLSKFNGELTNLYGPTETTIDAITFRCKDIEILKNMRTIPIGVPISNTQTYLLDKHMNPVPEGVVGEIYIGGAGLARGYLNQPRLTAEKFVPNPFVQEDSQRNSSPRLYRTGDLARYLSNGSIEFLGRTDEQVKIRGFRIELGEIESILQTHREVNQVVVIAREDEPGHKQLVAYIIPKEGAHFSLAPESTKGGSFSVLYGDNIPGLTEDLRNHLIRSLPDHMIPSYFIYLDQLPLTPNGKIDRKVLPAPNLSIRQTEDTYTAPQSKLEKELASIWTEVLRIKNIGIHDNFFRIGGDSIISIQMISKARLKGIYFTVQDIFSHPTIASLASVTKTQENVLNFSANQDVVGGEVPLTPIQLLFFNNKLAAQNHYNQAVLLKALEELDGECLERGLQSLLKVHSSLRLRFEEDEGGAWKQSYETYETLAEYRKGVCRVEHLDGLSKEEAAARRLEVMEEVQRSLNITKGPVFQGVLFKGSQEQGDSLFLVAHHLVVDSVSWRILIEDLEEAYRQAVERKEEIHLEPELRSYGWWSQELQALAQKETWKQEINYWENVLEGCQAQLPRELPGKGPNTVESMGEVTVELSEEETHQLLQKVPRSYRTQINDVLLTALGYAVKEWTGSGRVSLMLEGHGREQLTEEMDLSRTVGWFTSIYPVNIDLEGAEELGTGIKRVKEYLRNIPKKGIGYGMLRYLTQEGQERLDSKKEPEFSFNYLGQLDNSKRDSNLLQFSNSDAGRSNSTANVRQFLIEFEARIIDGVFQLTTNYSRNAHNEKEIKELTEKFIEQLRAIIHHCCFEKKEVSFSLSDFPLSGLDQASLDYILKNIPYIEDLYPLSPMQNTLLSTSIRSNNIDPYVRQNLFELSGDVKINLIKQAWQAVVNNEPILRTGFIWQGLNKPLQFVLPEVFTEWHEQDWQTISENLYPEKIQELLDMDYKSRFVLEKPPLLRFYMVKASSNKFFLLWSIHHILIDGWCLSILIQKFLTAYEQLNSNKPVNLSEARQYRNYVEWLQNQDLQVAEKFWKDYLSGIVPTQISSKKLKASRNVSRCNHFRFELNREKTELLKKLAAKEKLTLNNTLQTAWAILVAGYTQQTDIAFGVTVSGRAIDVKHADEMVGLFINTLPLRIKVTSERSIIDMMQEVREKTLLIQQYAYVPLAKIQTWIGLKGNDLLFDNLFIFENYPIEQKDLEKRGNMLIRPISSLSMEAPNMNEQTEFPLVLGVSAEEEILLNLSYNADAFSEKQAARIADHLGNIIDGFINYIDK